MQDFESETLWILYHLAITYSFCKVWRILKLNEKPKKYHNVETIPKSKRKIVKVAKFIPLTH